MKNILKVVSVLMALLICAVCAVTAFAVSVYTDGDYSYIDVDQYHVALYGYSGDSDVLVVPAYFSNRGVSQIYEYSFESNASISSIDFSQNQSQLNTIGTKAFNGCTSLSGTLTFPSSLRTLGYASFQGCTGLQTLYVNLGIREIPEQCFNRCSGLRTVYLPTELESIDRLAFGNCTNLESVYIPYTVTYINPYAFANSDPILYVYNESYAYQFALDNGYEYVIVDPPVDPTEPPTDPPTEAPTEPPTEPEPQGYLLGDTDNDDNVDVVDATWVQRAVAEMDVAPVQATLMQGNVDGDDLLTVIDATFIMRYTVNIATPYAIGERVV